MAFYINFNNDNSVSSDFFTKFDGKFQLAARVDARGAKVLHLLLTPSLEYVVSEARATKFARLFRHRADSDGADQNLIFDDNSDCPYTLAFNDGSWTTPLIPAEMRDREPCLVVPLYLNTANATVMLPCVLGGHVQSKVALDAETGCPIINPK